MLTKKMMEAAGNSAASYIEDVFSTYLYTGNGATQTITNGIDLAGNGGMVWNKSRSSNTYQHCVTDTVRGVGNSLDTGDSAANDYSITRVSAFNANGFTMGGNSRTNTSGATYASWTFREQPKFFDVVTYTGDGVTNRLISHNLASQPGCIIVKATSTTGDWYVWHRTQEGKFGYLNGAVAFFTGTPVTGAPSLYIPGANDSTQFWAPSANTSGVTYVAYLFAHNAGGFGSAGTDNVISCGSFTTDGSGNATVTLGYEPQWLLFKNSSGGADNWRIYDTMRGWSQTNDYELYPNSSSAESVGVVRGSPTATGFTITGFGASTTYVYIAIRRGPMKVPTDGTKVLSLLTYFVANNSTWGSLSSNGTQAGVLGGAGTNAVDLILSKSNNQTDNWLATPRLTGFTSSTASVSPSLSTNTTAAESVKAGGVRGDAAAASTGLQVRPDYSTATSVQWVNYIISRAPGFFDEVCYTGTGVAGTVTHNLGVAPELMIVKSRASALDWTVYSASLGASYWLYLNLTQAVVGPSANAWNSTTPTPSAFTVGTSTLVNASGGTYVAYLFASCPGVSKVGSYTGNGSTQTINCGFTGGARFILIKRTDSTGDWYVWDTARGIVASTDPHLSLNTTAAEVTTDDTIDPNSTGFVVNQLAATNVNVTSATYIYLAIA